MKKLIIFMVAVFLQFSVYGNTSTECIDPTNEELIEKLSNTDEIRDLVRLSFATGLLKMKESAALKEEAIVMTAEDIANNKANYDKIAKNYKIVVDKLMEENPALKKMEVKELNEVFNSAIHKSLGKSNFVRDIAECFADLIDVVFSCNVNAASALNKALFTGCIVVTGCADIQLAAESGGALFVVIEPVAEAEIGFCQAIAFGVSSIACLAGSIDGVVHCIMAVFD